MMVFTICGDLGREGVFELPLGSPLRYLVEELAGGPPAGRAIKAIFPGASNTVIVPQQPRRAAGLRLGAAGGFGPGRGRVRGVRRLGLNARMSMLLGLLRVVQQPAIDLLTDCVTGDGGT
jgi:hypothetical protein